MRPCKVVAVFLLLNVFLTGCGSQAVSLGPKREAVSYGGKTISPEGPVSLYITCDYSNIELYSWDKKEVKVEIAKKVRGIEGKDVLERELGNFIIAIENEKDKVFINSEYKGAIKGAADKTADLKVYMPKVISSLNCKLGLGTVKMYDDIKCRLNVDIDMANTEINRFEGRLSFKAGLGNLKIAAGRIEKGSEVLVDKGNISIKAEIENVGEYDYKTGMGNIDLMLPADSQVSFENVGTVESNEFKEAVYPAKIHLRTDMGKISIRKY